MRPDKYLFLNNNDNNNNNNNSKNIIIINYLNICHVWI